MECVELAPAVEPRHTSDSGSKLHALHTLRETRPPSLLRPCNLSRVPREICQENNNFGYSNSARRRIFEIVARRAEDRRALPAVTEPVTSTVGLSLDSGPNRVQKGVLMKTCAPLTR